MVQIVERLEDPSDDESLGLSKEEPESGHGPSTAVSPPYKDSPLVDSDLSTANSSSVGDMFHFPLHSTFSRATPTSVSPFNSSSSFSAQPLVADLIQQQNLLINELIKKHDSLSSTVAAIREDLGEAKLELSQLRVEKKYSTSQKTWKEVIPKFTDCELV